MSKTNTTTDEKKKDDSEPRLYAVNDDNKIVADSDQPRFPVHIKEYEERNPERDVTITDTHPIMDKLRQHDMGFM